MSNPIDITHSPIHYISSLPSSPPIIPSPMMTKTSDTFKDALPGLAALGIMAATRKVGWKVVKRQARILTRSAESYNRSAHIKSYIRLQEYFQNLKPDQLQNLANQHFNGHSSELIKLIKEQKHYLKSQKQRHVTNQASRKVGLDKLNTRIKLAGDVLSTFVTGYLTYLIEGDKAKQEIIKAQLNQRIVQFQQKGEQIKTNFSEQQKLQQEKREMIIDQMQIIISQLPEDQKNKCEEALQALKANLAAATQDSIEQIEEALSSFSSFKLLSSNPQLASLKDFSSQVALPFVGLIVFLSFSKLDFAKNMFQALVKIGIPERVVENVIVGSLAMISQEVVKSQISQHATLTEVKELVQQMAKPLGIDLTAKQEPNQTKDEKKLQESLTNTAIGIVHKMMKCLSDHPVLDTFETISNSIAKTAVGDFVEQAMNDDEAKKVIDREVVTIDKAMIEKVDQLKHRISQLEEKEATQLGALKQKVQELFDTQQQIDEEKVQSQAQPASITRWFKKYLW